MGSTLVAEPDVDATAMVWRWADDYLDVANVRAEPGSRAAEEPSGRSGEAWSMVWRVDADGTTVGADLRDPGGRQWRYDRFTAGSMLAVDVSDFRFLDQAD